MMLPARPRSKSCQTFREGVPSDNGDEDYGPKDASHSVATRGRKSTAPTTATLKRKGKQPGKRRNAGKLSKLPNMPLDILYDVSHKVDSFTDDRIDNHPFNGDADTLSRSPVGPTTDIASQQGIP